MDDDRPMPLDARLYRAALRLCPGEFRRDHADEMACDFDDARSEAAAAGTRAVWIFRLLVGTDLARTFLVQWLRTGLPVIGGAALLFTLLLGSAVASAARFVTARMRVDRLPSDAGGIL